MEESDPPAHIPWKAFVRICAALRSRELDGPGAADALEEAAGLRPSRELASLEVRPNGGGEEEAPCQAAPPLRCEQREEAEPPAADACDGEEEPTADKKTAKKKKRRGGGGKRLDDAPERPGHPGTALAPTGGEEVQADEGRLEKLGSRADGAREGCLASPGRSAEELPRWLRKNGADVSAKLELKLRTDGERTVVARQDLKAGEETFSLPERLWLTAGLLHKHEGGRAVLAWASTPDQPLSSEHLEVCLLAVLLLFERAAGSPATFHAYTASLPWDNSDHLPLTWSSERLVSQLKGAAPQWGIEAKQRELRIVYNSLRDLFTNKGKSSLESWTRVCGDAAALIHAFALVHSRAMNVPSRDGRWNLALLPFADMLNHASEPEVHWEAEVATGSVAQVVGRASKAVSAGTELHLRYRGAAAAQAFFATYGFVEAGSARPTELRVFWEQGLTGEDATINLSSCRSLRRLLSRLRVAAADAQEAGRLDRKVAPSDRARLPLSVACERRSLEQLSARLSARALLGQEEEAALEAGKTCLVASPATALRAADAGGWARLGSLTTSVLAEIKAQDGKLNAAQLGILLHRAIRQAVLGTAARLATDTSQMDTRAMLTRRSGDSRGDGYFAHQRLLPGRFLLAEDPYILDRSDDDFAGLAAVHVLGGAQEFRVDCEGDEQDGSIAARWLRGVEGVSAKQAAQAYSIAAKNCFETTMPDAPEDAPVLLFQRLCVFNHSCWPNCAVYRDASSGRARVHVTHPVEPGDELTIHYSDELIALPTAFRRILLKGYFSFECHCTRCDGLDPAAHMIEVALEKCINDPQKKDAAFRAHKSLCRDGLNYKEFDDWSEALVAVEAVMPTLAAYGDTTHWLRHHARALKCIALEGLGKDAAAFLTLAEHAAAAWRVLPPYCQALLELHKRLEAVRGRLQAAGLQALEQKAEAGWGEALQGLSADMARLRGWLATE